MKYPALWSVAVVGLLMAAKVQAVTVGPIVPVSTYSFIQSDDGQFKSSTSDESLLFQQSGGYSATAQTSFGVNRVFASAQGTNGWVEAASVWTDAFTVSAPADVWVPVMLSIRLSGSNRSVAPAAALADGGGEYDLLVRSDYLTPVELLASMDLADNEALIKFGLDEVMTYGEVVSRTFLVKAGDTFFVSSVLDVGASQDQVLDFAHSVHFGISAGPGATLTSASRTIYAASVPEVGGVWLGMAGLAVLGLASARGRRRPIVVCQ